MFVSFLVQAVVVDAISAYIPPESHTKSERLVGAPAVLWDWGVKLRRTRGEYLGLMSITSSAVKSLREATSSRS